jgi:uncharacterized protein YabE (DUF348 family)
MRRYCRLIKDFLNKYHQWLFPVTVMMILAGLSLIWLGLHQTSTVIVGGEPIYVETTAWRVSDVLRAAGIALGEDDRLTPEGDPWFWEPAVITVEPARQVLIRTPENAVWLHSAERIPANLIAALDLALFPQDQVLVNGEAIDPDKPLVGEDFLLIQLRPAVAVNLVVDGHRTTFYTQETTLGAALEVANIRVSPQDWISEDLMTPLDDQLDVSIKRARAVRINVGETVLTGLTAGATVRDALLDLGITLQNLDYTHPAEGDPIPEDGEIEVVQVEEMVTILKDEVAYQNEYVEDPNTVLDQISVVAPGRTGIYATRERVRVVEGEEVWRDQAESWQASEAADGLLGYGSKVEVRTEVVDGQEIEFWRKISVYATSFSPCRLGLGEGVCNDRTASGLPLQKGVIGVTRSWYNMMRLQPVYVQGYGRGVIADIGGGSSYFNHYWIDLGYSEADYQRWANWTTMYFLTPVPDWYPAVLPWP